MNSNVFKELVWIVVFLIFGFFWVDRMMPGGQNDQLVNGAICLALVIAGIIAKNRFETMRPQLSVFISILILSCAFIAVFYAWNIGYFAYLEHFDYRENIFRPALHIPRTPFYGHPFSFNYSAEDLPNNLPTIISALLFAVGLFFVRNQLSRLPRNPLFYTSLVLLILGLNWNESLLETFSGTNCHYHSFGFGLENFQSVGDILKNFTTHSTDMGIHNNHYPPGNLIVLAIEKWYIPFFSKILVFSAVLVALIPLGKLMRSWNFTAETRTICYLVYAVSGSIMFFPEIAMSPLVLPIVVSGFYFIDRALFTSRIVFFSILFGVMMALFAFFSFSVFFFILFCAIYLLIELIRKRTNWKQLLVFGVISGGTFVSIFVLIDLLSGFNLVDCLLVAMKNEELQMDAKEGFDIIRYLMQSSANFIAYIGIISLPLIAVIVHGFRIRKQSVPSKVRTLTHALLITILVFSFSGQFFLEVERIWIFLTPFWLLVGGWFIAQWQKEHQVNLVYALITMMLLITVVLKVKIDFCY